MPGFGGLAGLSGVYGGYQAAEGEDLQNRLRQLQVGKGQYELSGMQGADQVLANSPSAVGLALSGMNGPIPGIGALGQGGPQGAPPQQAPQMPPQMPQPMGGQPGPAMPPPGGQPRMPPPPGGAFSGGGTAASMGGGGDLPPPGPGARRPMQPPQQLEAPAGMTQMPDWRGIWQELAKSNPGAPPQALIGAMDKLIQWRMPLERAQWAEQRNMLTTMLGMNRLEQGERILAERTREFDTREGRLAQEGERKIEQGDRRIEQGERRIEQAGRSFEERKREFNIRDERGGLGPRSAIGQFLQKFQSENPGASAEDVKRAAQNYHSEQVAMSRFFSGDRSKTIAALDNVVGHLGTLKKLGEAWAAGDIQTFNALGAEWVALTGGAAPTNIQTAGAIVGPEVLKALNVAQAGTGEERQQIKNIFDTAKSPEQFNQAIDVARKLLSRQFRTQRRQFQVATGLPAERFDAMLSPDVRPYLDEEEGAAPLKQGGGFSVGAPVK